MNDKESRENMNKQHINTPLVELNVFTECIDIFHIGYRGIGTILYHIRKSWKKVNLLDQLNIRS